MDFLKANIKTIAFYLQRLILLAIVVFMAWPRLNLDFWNDELYSLEHFVLVPLSKTLGDYHVPNNHILFNFFQNLYLKLIGLETMPQVLEHPLLVRLPNLVYLFLSLFLFGRILDRIGGRQLALLGLGILISFIPFQNFAFQLRAYGLSITLLLWLVNAFQSYQINKEIRQLTFMALATFGAFYAVPSNLYFVFAFASYLVLDLVAFSKERNLSIKALLAIFSGLLLAGLAYSPIFEEVFFNEYVERGLAFDWNYTSFLLMHYIESMSFMMAPIFLLAILGIVLGLWRRRLRVSHLVLAVFLLVVPFLISFIRGDQAPARVFVPGIPFLAMALALAMEALLKGKKPTGANEILANSNLNSGWLMGLFLSLLILILNLISPKLYASFYQEILLSEDRAQGLLYQYYSQAYHPRKTVSTLLESNKDEELPVLVKGCEPHGIRHFLEAQHLDFQHDYNAPHALDSLLILKKPFYVITNSLGLGQIYAETKWTLLSQDSSYHNLFRIEANLELLESLEAYAGDSAQLVLNTYAEWSSKSRKDSIKDWLLLANLKKERNPWFLKHLGGRDILKFESLQDLDLVWAKEDSARKLYDFQVDTLGIDFNISPEEQFQPLINEPFLGLKYVLVKAELESDSKMAGYLALQINRADSTYHWQAEMLKLDEFRQAGSIEIPMELPESLEPSDQVKLYFWANAGQRTVIKNTVLGKWKIRDAP